MNNLLKFRFKVFALMALLAFNTTGTFAQQKETIAIVDAGSSGSRLFIYEVDKTNFTISELGSEGLGIQLSSITNDNAAKQFISKIADFQAGTAQVPLYILATAGMRQCSDPNTVYRLLTAENNQQQLSGKYSLQKAMTISGRSEGLYAWIAENYTKNKLKANTKATSEP